MSETVEAIGYKADVPSRAKDKVSDTATRAKEAVVGTASRAGDVAGGAAGRVSDATPSGGEVKQQARRTAGLANSVFPTFGRVCDSLLLVGVIGGRDPGWAG